MNYQNRGLLYLNTDVRGSAIRDIFKPAAIEFEQYVYCVWNDYEGNTIIGKINVHSSSDIHMVKVAPRSDFASDIEHATPTFCIDNDGYIYVFYGSHATQQYYRKSVHPKDITLWSNKLSLTGATAATYPLPVVLKDNTIVVIFRQGGSSNRGLSAIKSHDGGSSWSSLFTLVDADSDCWVYPISIVMGTQNAGSQSIHIQFALRDDQTGAFSKSSYICINQGLTESTDVAGNAVLLPVSTTDIETTGNIVINAESGYPGDLKLNSEMKPYLVFNDSGTTTIKFAKWSGNEWIISTVTDVPEYQYEHAELDHISDLIIDVYTVNGTATEIQGGDIERWRSTDGGESWSLAESITDDANEGFRYFFPKIVMNYTGNIKLLYQGGIPRSSYNQPVISRLYTYPTTSLQNISPDKNIYFDISSKTTEQKTEAYTKGKTDYSEAYKNRHGSNIIQGEWSNDDLHYFVNTLGATFFGDYENGQVEKV